MTKYWGDALEKLFAARKSLPHDAFIDLEYSDLVRDPIAAVRKLYSRLGSDLSRDAELRLRAFLSAHPNGKHGNHTYTLTAFDMDPIKLRERFSSYRAPFSGYYTNRDH